MTSVCWTDLGCRPYAETWALQHRLVAGLKAGDGPDRLLLVEHPPVLTLGRRTDAAHVLLDRPTLTARGYEVFEVERGGDVTYHGPGQLVAYPVLDLRRHRKDVRWFAATLLDSVVATVAACGVAARARTGVETGVWVPLTGGGEAKVASLGVRIEAWVTYHGVAINVTTDLSRFEVIVPCGLSGVRMASLATLPGTAVDLAAVRSAFVAAFGQAFGVTMVEDPGLAVGAPVTVAGGGTP